MHAILEKVLLKGTVVGIKSIHTQEYGKEGLDL